MNGPKKIAAAVACALAALSSADALAQAADKWMWRGSIYAYLPDLSGSTTFPANSGGSSGTVDAGTIIDNLKFTL